MGLWCWPEIFKTQIIFQALRKRRWQPERGGFGGALSVSCLLKTWKHILSCTEYLVGEQDAWSSTQASHDGCLVGKGQRGRIWDRDAFSSCVSHSTRWLCQVKRQQLPFPLRISDSLWETAFISSLSGHQKSDFRNPRLNFQLLLPFNHFADNSWGRFLVEWQVL